MKKDKYASLFYADGLDLESAKKRYFERRKRLRRSFKMPIAISAVKSDVNQNNIWSSIESKIYQEPLFFYLTGINQPNCILFMDNNSKENKEILFVEKRDIQKEFWVGARFGSGDADSLAIVKNITGISKVLPHSDFPSIFIKNFKQSPNEQAAILWHESPRGEIIQDSNNNFRKKVFSLLRKHQISPEEVLVNVSNIQFKQRLSLDKIDSINAEKANIIATGAFINLLKNLSNMKYEYEAAGFLDGQLRTRTPYGQSFPTIAACGENATILHYEKNSDSLQQNELILFDFGVRVFAMPSDVSRTVPVNGKFNPLQRILYTIVLNAQKLVEKNVMPGITINKLNDLCWDFINCELEEKINQKGGSYNLPYMDRPHGVSHLIAIAIHDGDPFGLYKKQKIKQGWLLSNEPGVYGFFSLTIDGVLYEENIGIRIEDDLLVTENGCQNLTKKCPKEIEQLEKLIQNSKD